MTLILGILLACGAPAAEPATPAAADSGAGAASPGGPLVGPGAPATPPMPPSGKRFGATPYDGGVELRVWAPHAKAVAVAGEITGALTLEDAASGTFAARIAGAHVGQRYHFSITTSDGTSLDRLDPHARAVDGIDAIVIDPWAYRWKTKAFTPPAREAAVVYELHVGSFTAGGTFTSAIDKLDALADLGINTIELMPVNLHGAHGWGYGPRGFFAPHPDYGTPDDLRGLVDQAHARGIAVMLDVVFNHYDGWSQAPLRCFDGYCPDGTAGIYFFEQDPYRSTPWGPRPNYAKPEVSDFLADSVFAWTREYGVDGFRQDSVSNIRALDGQGSVPGGVDVLRRMNDVVAKSRSGALLVAEDLKGEATITQAAAAGGLGFDAQWDGGFQNDITTAVAASTDAARDLGAVRNAILGNYDGDPFKRLLYVETHDTAGNSGARLPVKIDAADPTSTAAQKRAMLAAGLLFVTPGVPMLFMGQEMLESTKFAVQPAPLDWSRAATFAGVRTFYRDLIRLRRNLDGVSAGLLGAHVEVIQQNELPGNKVIALRRWNAGGDDVMVVANFGAKKYARYDIGLPTDGAWKARVDGDDVRYGATFGASGPTPVTVLAQPRDGLPFTGGITLGPYALVVLTRN